MTYFIEGHKGEEVVESFDHAPTEGKRHREKVKMSLCKCFSVQGLIARSYKKVGVIKMKNPDLKCVHIKILR